MQTKIFYWWRGERDFLYIRSVTISASKVHLGACGRAQAQSRSFHGKHWLYMLYLLACYILVLLYCHNLYNEDEKYLIFQYSWN